MKKENSISNKTVEAAGEYATTYLQEHLDKQFCYHDQYHTFCVVNAVGIICRGMNISEQETRILMVAAWFHDTGYTKQQQGHEEVSALIAEEFLLQKNISTEEIELVKNCILATKYPQYPANIPEQVICDADMFHLAESNLPERSEKLRTEWAVAKRQTYSDKNWYELNIRFLAAHRFNTSWCRENLQEGITRNIMVFKEKMPAQGHGTEAPKPSSKEKKEKPLPMARPERGVETLFRIASGNHMKLSAMADNKAHILLSINSVIISVVLSVLAKNLSTHTYLVFPTAFLLLSCLASLVFAVLTTKPKLSKGVFTAEQINNREANLLFFGNFHQMQWEAYEWGIKEIMYDKDYLYKSMTKDIYFLGRVLATKYKYLNAGYKIFMYGLICTIITFLVSLYFA